MNNDFARYDFNINEPPPSNSNHRDTYQDWLDKQGLTHNQYRAMFRKAIDDMNENKELKSKG